MTAYEMEGFLRGKCLPGDMKVNESNAQYLVRKFSEFESNLSESKREFRAADATIHNLELRITDMAVQLANAESKCRDLAAENAGLNVFIEEECFVYSNDTPEPIDANDCKPETPATNAFLAEVRAQGVEMFAHDVGEFEQGNGLMKAIGRRAIKFAAQLRKGVQS